MKKEKLCISLDSNILKLLEQAKKENPSVSRSSIINSALQFYFSSFEFKDGMLIREEPRK